MADDLSANYAGAYHGHLAPGDRMALLVIDVAEAYLQPESSLYDTAFEIALRSIRRLVSAARTAGMPVVFTTVSYAEGGRDGGLFYRKVPALAAFVAGSPLAAFPPSLRPDPGEVVIVKQYASAFFGTSLASTLRAEGIDTLLIVGFSTSGCVRASAVDALQHGFVPLVVRDGCGDRHPAPHDASLFDLQAKYAEVLSEAEAMALLPPA